MKEAIIVGTNLAVIGSLWGHNGENILIHALKDDIDMVLITVGKIRKWEKLRYDMVPDGTYNQSVKDIELPYFLNGKDVYSVGDITEIS